MTTAIATAPAALTPTTTNQYYDRIRAAANRYDRARKTWQHSGNMMLIAKWDAGVVVREHYEAIVAVNGKLMTFWAETSKATGMSAGWLRKAMELAETFKEAKELASFVDITAAEDFASGVIHRRKRKTLAERQAATQKAVDDAVAKTKAEAAADTKRAVDEALAKADSFTGPDVVNDSPVDDQVVDHVLGGLSEVVKILSGIQAITTDHQERALSEVTAQVHRLTNPGDQS